MLLIYQLKTSDDVHIEQPTKKILAKKRGQSRFFPSQRGIP